MLESDPPGSRWGVRLRDVDDMRRMARLIGIIWWVFGVSNVLFAVVSFDHMPHPRLFSLMGPMVLVIGSVLLASAAVVRDERYAQVYVPLLLVTFAVSATITPLTMYWAGYPASGGICIAYAIIAILSFWLASRWLAFVVVAWMVVGHGFLEMVTPSPFPAWLVVVFIAGALVMAGFLTGQAHEIVERSRNSERTASRSLAELNATLETKVAEQVEEVERLGRLRRFLSAPVADAVLSSSDESVLAPHRREIAVLFCDLRGFTAFTKQVEPEEVMEVLDAYYAAAGEQISRFHATLGSFEGDGLMAYLNDPVPCEEPAKRVVEMGLAIADALDALTPRWQRRGYDLSYGIGMALGHATLGIVGYDGRNDYTALGTVVNLGARLCDVAKARQLVADHRVFLQTENDFDFIEGEPVTLKGFGDTVANYLVNRT